MREALSLTFPTELITQPIIHQMSKKFDVVFNLRRAKITEKVGEIVLELEGQEETVRKAEDWLRKQGLKVEPVTKDTIES